MFDIRGCNMYIEYVYVLINLYLFVYFWSNVHGARSPKGVLVSWCVDSFSGESISPFDCKHTF